MGNSMYTIKILKSVTQKVFIVILLCSLVRLTTQNVQAQKATATPSAQATDSATIQGIKKIIQENISSEKVMGAIDNLLNKNVGLIGKVTRITDSAISLSNQSGTKILPLDSSIVITKENKPIGITDIAVDNWVTVLGKMDDTTLVPKFIFVSTKDLRPKTQFITIGTITKIEKNSITVLPRSGGEEKVVTLVKTTKYEDADGETIKLATFTNDVTVLITGYVAETGIEAATIRSLATL